jgi:hypothetical protein
MATCLLILSDLTFFNFPIFNLHTGRPGRGSGEALPLTTWDSRPRLSSRAQLDSFRQRKKLAECRSAGQPKAASPRGLW